MYLRQSWHRAATLGITTLAFCGYAPSRAADVGGTTWRLTGSQKLSVAGVKPGKLNGGSGGHADLIFDGAAGITRGTCHLNIFDKSGAPVDSFPCTWETADLSKPPFTIELDSSAMKSYLEDQAASHGRPATVDIASDTGLGRVTKLGRMTVMMHIAGTLQFTGDSRIRKLNLILRGRGTKV